MGLDMYITSRKRKDTWNSLVYWRQFNALHAWFVSNVQNGVDDCGRYIIPKKKLVELIDVLKQAKDTKDTSLLPAQKGFFFGNQEYDESYWQLVDHSIQKLENILSTFDFNKDKLIYEASW